jgi:hypothetical protein
MPETFRQATRVFGFPFLYFANMVPVMVGVIVVLSLVEFGALSRYDMLHSNVELVGLASLFVVGGLVFGLLGLTFSWLEKTPRPTLVDHLRRCSFLYVFVALLTATLAPEIVANLLAGNGAYEIPLGTILPVLGGYAILVDAMVLLFERRRAGRTRKRNPA